MIQIASLHQSKKALGTINDVIRAHHGTFATVTFLKDKVQALEEQNMGLSARVAVLEQSTRCRLRESVGRRGVTNGIAASRTEVAKHEADKLAEQKRLAEEKQMA